MGIDLLKTSQMLPRNQKDKGKEKLLNLGTVGSDQTFEKRKGSHTSCGVSEVREELLSERLMPPS